jgi:hypothetical protein
MQSLQEQFKLWRHGHGMNTPEPEWHPHEFGAEIHFFCGVNADGTLHERPLHTCRRPPHNVAPRRTSPEIPVMEPPLAVRLPLLLQGVDMMLV